MWFITNTEVTSDNVDSHVHNVVDITAVNVAETLIEPRSTQHHLTHTEHSLTVYAIPSWGCYLTAELTGKIDAFLRTAHRYGFAANIQTVSELFLFDKAAQDL